MLTGVISTPCGVLHTTVTSSILAKPGGCGASKLPLSKIPWPWNTVLASLREAELSRYLSVPPEGPLDYYLCGAASDAVPMGVNKG